MKRGLRMPKTYEYRDIMMWRTRRRARVASVLVAIAGLAVEVAAQGPAVEVPMTMDEAVRRALVANRSLGAAAERARAARAGAEAAGAFRWPEVGIDAGLVRSDDPVAAFGTQLRQGRFGEADLRIDALNDPDAVSDWSAAAGLRWTALDATRWSALDASRASASEAEARTARAAVEVVYGVRVAFAAVVRAEAREEAAAERERAARASRDLIERRRSVGMLTDVDVLRGEAALAEATAQRVAAEAGVGDARDRLALVLGLGPDSLPAPRTGVDDASAPVEEASTAATTAMTPVQERGDVRAAQSRLRRAEAEAERASRARLPRAELSAGLSRHAPAAFDDGRTHSTVALSVALPLFTGGALDAGRDVAEARRRAAELELAQAEAQARTERREAGRAVGAAAETVRAAEAASSAAVEARRLMRRRFEEGLATTTDLLQADAEAARLRARAIDARAALAVARASLALARGGGPGHLQVTPGGAER